MQARGSAPPPIGVAFEGDLGHRIDAVLALAMLYGIVGKGGARSVALAVSRPHLDSARLADVIGGFYVNRPAAGFMTVGMPEGQASGAAALTPILATQRADGTRPYASQIGSTLDTADNAVLIRNQLLAQHDGNAAVVVAGPVTGLVRLMNLFGARPQIAAKVKHLVLAIGSFAPGEVDATLKADVAAAKRLFAEWPSPIVVAGAEVGKALPYPGSSIDKDFSWSQAHPVVDAYRLGGPMPYDAPGAALAAIAYAVYPAEGYFSLSAPGTISVADDGRLSFAAGGGGRHRYLMVDPAQRERVAKLYTDLVSAAPVRAGRGGRGTVPPPAAAAPATPPPTAPPATAPRNP